MNWKGVMPAITTCFTDDLRRSRLHGETLPLAARQRLHGNRCARVAGRRRNLVVRREVADSAHLCRAPSVDAPSGRFHLVPDNLRSGSFAKAAAIGLRWPDGSASLCLPGRLARDEDACGGGFPGHAASCMLYNNPVAYGTDFLPEQIRELAAEHENFEAVKESSTDARRVSAIRALVDRRLRDFCGRG